MFYLFIDSASRRNDIDDREAHFVGGGSCEVRLAILEGALATTAAECHRLHITNFLNNREVTITITMSS